MNSFLLDASALAKRFTPEPGAGLIDHLFETVSQDRLQIVELVVAEVVSVLVRKRNQGVITPDEFRDALLEFGADILRQPAVVKHCIDSQVIAGSLPLIERHSLNATDAAILCVAIRIDTELRSAGNRIVLVAADRRLIRSALAENIRVFNPEADSPELLDSLSAEA